MMMMMIIALIIMISIMLIFKNKKYGYYAKNYQTNYKYYDFFSKNIQILATFTWCKKGQQIQAQVTEQAMPESKQFQSN